MSILEKSRGLFQNIIKTTIFKKIIIKTIYKTHPTNIRKNCIEIFVDYSIDVEPPLTQKIDFVFAKQKYNNVFKTVKRRQNEVSYEFDRMIFCTKLIISK
jgi:hypothetical protein